MIFRQGRCIISFLSFSSAKRCLWRSLHQFIIASHYLFLFYFFFFCFIFVFVFILHSHSEAWSSSQKIPRRPLVPILFLETRAGPLAIRLSPIESVSIQSGETSKRERKRERERARLQADVGATEKSRVYIYGWAIHSQSITITARAEWGHTSCYEPRCRQQAFASDQKQMSVNHSAPGVVVAVCLSSTAVFLAKSDDHSPGCS